MNNFPIRPEVAGLVPSATLLINERSKELTREGRRIFKLGFGQSPFPIPDEIVDKLCFFASEKDYLPVQGLPALREAVSAYYQKSGLDYDLSRIMIGPGSKELILGIQMVCDADLLLPNPSWVSYEPQSHLARSNVIWVETKEEDKWMVTSDSLEHACLQSGDRPKILILNYPSNPVGTTLNEQNMMGITDIARKYGVLIVADEIYGALTYSGNHKSIATYYPEGTVLSSGLSKWAGAGGWRLGTFCFPKELDNVLNAMKVLASESFSAVSAPIQYASITAFTGSKDIDSYLNSSRKILQTIGKYVYQKLQNMGVTMPAAEGGFYLFPNFNNFRKSFKEVGVNTSVDFCEKLIDETGVALLPGSAFGRPPGELTCRLSFVDFDGKKLLEIIKEGNFNESLIIENCPGIKDSMQILSNWLEKLR